MGVHLILSAWFWGVSGGRKGLAGGFRWSETGPIDFGMADLHAEDPGRGQAG